MGSKKVVGLKLSALLISIFMLIGILIQPVENIRGEGIEPRIAQDVTSKVNISAVDVSLQLGSDWEPIVVDGVAVPGHPAIYVNHQVRFEYKWHITQQNMASINPGDYFEIALPGTYFSFSDTGDFDLTDSTNPGEVLGSWKIVNGKMVVTFNGTGAGKDYMDNGFLKATGLVIQSGENIEINTGGQTLPPIEINPEINEELVSDYNMLYKRGSQMPNANKIQWMVYINYDNYRAMYKGDPFETINNVMFVDILEEGQVIDESIFEIATVLYGPTATNSMSGKAMAWIPIHLQFQKLTANPGETYDDFYGRLESNSTPAYGFYDGDTVIINFKNIPSGDGTGIKGFDDSYLRTFLDDKVSADFTQPEADHMFDVYHSQGPSKGDVVGFALSIKADVTDGSREYSNQAKLTYSNTEFESNEALVSFQEIEGGANTGDPGSITIRKKDDAGVKLQGVSFKLQYDAGSGNFVDYDPSNGGDNGPQVRTTDVNGEVVFKLLTSGTYKIVEVLGLPGYKDTVTFSPSDTVTITGLESAGYMVGVTNYLGTGRIELVKKSDDNILLKNAGFLLYKEEDGVVNFSMGKDAISGEHQWSTDETQGLVYTSDENGRVLVDGLSPGTHYFKEVSAPVGYVLDEAPVAFEVTREHIITPTVVRHEKINVKIPTEPSPEPPSSKEPGQSLEGTLVPESQLPKTGGYGLFVLGIVLVSAGALILVLKKRITINISTEEKN